MIRHAAPEDIPACVEMVRQFHTAAGLESTAAFVAEDFALTLERMIDAEEGILLVADDGGPIGMAGGLAYPMYFNHAHKTGQEMFWWVLPDRRGVGAELLSALEAEARQRGCKSWAMIGLEGMKSVDSLYERRGYRPFERLWIKEL